MSSSNANFFKCFLTLPSAPQYGDQHFYPLFLCGQCEVPLAKMVAGQLSGEVPDTLADFEDQFASKTQRKKFLKEKGIKMPGRPRMTFAYGEEICSNWAEIEKTLLEMAPGGVFEGVCSRTPETKFFDHRDGSRVEVEMLEVSCPELAAAYLDLRRRGLVADPAEWAGPPRGDGPPPFAITLASRRHA